MGVLTTDKVKSREIESHLRTEKKQKDQGYYYCICKLKLHTVILVVFTTKK